jgi:hypothetical protein
MRESALVLYEWRIIAASYGGPASVEFDFDAVWGFKKSLPRFYPKLLTWIHVHPPGFGPEPSTQDDFCAKGFKAAFGEIGEFLIFCFNNDDPNDTHGKKSVNGFDGKRLSPITVEAIGREHYREAHILKLLSLAKEPE